MPNIDLADHTTALTRDFSVWLFNEFFHTLIQNAMFDSMSSIKLSSVTS
jgi:hypothetical protein